MTPVRKPDNTEVVKIRISTTTKEIIMKEADKNYRTFAEECRLRLDRSVKVSGLESGFIGQRRTKTDTRKNGAK